MSSTVTPTTVATVTASALTATLGLIAIGTLLALLIQKELLARAANAKARALAETLDVVIVPLLMAAALILLVKLAEALS